MITNLKMFRLLTSLGFHIKENIGDKEHNLIVVGKNDINLKVEWCPQFSSISVQPAKVKDIITLQCAGAIKNIIAVNKWCCVEEDIKKVCKCIDIMTEAYAKIREL